MVHPARYSAILSLLGARILRLFYKSGGRRLAVSSMNCRLPWSSSCFVNLLGTTL